MIQKLKLHLSNLVTPYLDKKYLLAVSGGVDSIVMTQLFYELGIDFEIAHCNFQLRGVDSDADERLVSIIANRLNKKIHIKRFDTLKQAETEKVSIQMIARSLRYEWFQELSQNLGFDFIVTAHHKNDLTETILLNLCKGTGHAGLVGIKSINENILRPLLIFEKNEIINFAENHQLKWRDDASNSSDAYQRNHLRLNVIPLLEKINPKVDDAFVRTSEKLSASNLFINKEIEKYKNKWYNNKSSHVEINFEIDTLGDTAAFVLSEFLRPFQFDLYKCQRIISHDKSEPGAIFESETHKLVCDRNNYIITPNDSQKNNFIEFYVLPNSFEFGTFKFETQKIVYTKDTQVLANEFLLPESFWNKKITIRFRKDADDMAPFGMKGKRKKIGDILNDVKLPLNLKDRIPLFEVEGEIFWITGIRASEFCKVNPNTNVIKVKKI